MKLFNRADIAVVGLAVMGQNLILNMNDHGFVVINSLLFLNNYFLTIDINQRFVHLTEQLKKSIDFSRMKQKVRK